MKSLSFEKRIEVEVKEVEGIFFKGEKYKMQAEYLEHNVPTLGYRFIEKNRRKVNITAAKELGLQEGPLLGDLQEGKTITHKGKKIKPDDVTTIVKGKVIAR